MTLYRNLDQSDVALIELVKSLPQIYDHDNASFRSVQSKEDAWDDIAKELVMAKEDAKRRWINLRDRYTRELKNKRLHPEKEFRKNELFHLMDFLRGFVRRRSRRYNNDILHLKLQNQTDMKTDINMEDTMTDDDDVSSAVENQNNTEMDTNAFPEFVEVDENVTYEDLIDQHSVETANSSRSSMEKPMLTELSAAVATATTTTNTYEDVLQHSQQQEQQQQKQKRQNNLQQRQQQQQQQQQQIQLQQQQNSFYQLQNFGTKYKQTTNDTPPTNNNVTLEQQLQQQQQPVQETEDDFFCKTMAVYLKQLNRKHKIRAQIEMLQILQKYVDLEEDATTCHTNATKRKIK